MKKNIKSTPQVFPVSEVLEQSLSEFLPKNGNHGEKVIRTRILKGFSLGTRWSSTSRYEKEKTGVDVWTGKVRVGDGFPSFHRQPVTTVRQLLFVRVDDLSHVHLLGKQSLDFLNQRLAQHGLKIGMAVP